MIMPIVMYGDPVLRRQGDKVGEITPELRQLVPNMLETMVANNGIGLAAPQVGLSIQLAVIDIPDPDASSYFIVNGRPESPAQWMPLAFINPEVTGVGETEASLEGCLSFGDIRGSVVRPSAVSTKMTLIDGREVVIETDGLIARAIQHEVDHLNGVLFIDRMTPAAKNRTKKQVNALLNESKKKSRGQKAVS